MKQSQEVHASSKPGEERLVGYPGKVPPAKEESGHDPRNGGHVHVFRHEEHSELHAAVLQMEACHQFPFGFRQVKGQAVGFRERGDKEDQKAQGLVEDPPVGKKSPYYPFTVIRLICLK